MKTNNFYKEIYYIANPEHLRNKQWNSFLMVGEKNWDHYFSPFKTKQDYEILKNVELLEFFSANEMFKHLKKIDPTSLLNYCFDDKFYILKYA
jgi:hypothetical protein